MHLEKLTLLNYKNYSQTELELSPGINCFVGNNGVGKTNILDAIYYLSQTRSYITTIESQNIRHGADFFLIQGLFRCNGTKEQISCGYRKGRKKMVKRNDKEYDRMSDHIGLIPTVMISPSDTQILTGGSEERRKFIDQVISQYDRPYLDQLIRYNKALQQRNSLLKQYIREQRFDPDMLRLWEKQMAPLAAEIYDKRKAFVEEIFPVFSDYYNQISMQREQVRLKYRSHLEKNNLEELFLKNMERDRILQYTSVGTHRDDLAVEMDGYPMKKIGSQGQQKTLVVALKLAKMQFITTNSGFPPILLLDDVFDKFDAGRVEQIINLVSGNRFEQIIITDTSTDRLNLILDRVNTDYKLFRLGNKAGIIEEVRHEKK